MAQKTASRKFSLQSTSRSTERQFLSHPENIKELYYQYDADEKTVASNLSSENKIVTPVIASDQPSSANVPASGAVKMVQPDKSPAPSTPVAKVDASVVASIVTDIPLSATDVVLALTAQKLRKAFDQVSMERSIRDLCGGVQFQLRADLH